MKTHIVFGVLTVILLIIVISAKRQVDFSFENVISIARLNAQQKPAADAGKVPKFLKTLDYDQYRDIRWRDEQTLWRKEGLPFQAKFFLPGHIFSRAVDVKEIHDGTARNIPFSPAYFDYGKNVFKEKVPEDLGYSGFRIYYPINSAGKLDEVAVFLGASYFRMVNRDMVFGLSARGLALGIGTSKEEFPTFTRFWLRKPEAFAKKFTLMALLESKSVTGAYEFEIAPGDETQVRVRAVLFFRNKVKGIGLAPMTSMYWFGENTSNTFGDFRPEVHDSDGLLIHKESGEWLWHPLAWSQQTQVNVFKDTRTKGFGLLQRDRDFNHYQDLEAVYHNRPSLWIEPIKGFEDGAVELVQLPTKNEAMDNVSAFWTVNNPPTPLQPVELEYVLRWLRDSPDLPPLGRCVSTRIDYQDAPYFRHYFLEFAGGPLNSVSKDKPPQLEVSKPDGAVVSEEKIDWNDFNKSWRASFIVSTKEHRQPIELLCRLKNGDTALTETWSYTWVP